ncbi:redoxin domain-containing protein [Conexibacter sp. W3-3-2]|uniref:TlpA family protein disulfide reductase n=1 Tax=Conexibacter sp. W3-3-2 TaxID=2675227 RepID=UPI0012B97264|nr:TlpA disulfide reductase family protein [Conexibacter sp. W3-3-2]MTD47506.1 redoxin domain-containing protein [Conexibacter sp. W3-3-2]
MNRAATTRPRLATIVAVLVALWLAACGGGTPQGGDGIRGGGTTAFKAHLATLEGTPVVVNQWASWCTPCRQEFPYFRDQAKKRNGEVAFVGVNSMDSTDDAASFLRESPLPFPQFADPDADIARTFRGGRAWPTTAYYDASGELVFTHQGAYRSEADLAADIQRYAIDGG